MKKNEILQTWINKADHDLSSAKIILLHIPENNDVIGFLCQQSIEKYLKAFLIYLDIEFKYIHDFRYLLELIGTKDNSLDKFYDEIIKLNDFAVKIRYPDIIINPSIEELKEIIALADNLRKIVLEKMNLA